MLVVLATYALAASLRADAPPTEFLELGDGRIAYDVAGEGPLVVMLPGLGDLRQEYRFLAPLLAQAGYRVATVDVRGHGESSVGWPRYDSVAVGQDLLALVDHLGGPRSSSATPSRLGRRYGPLPRGPRRSPAS